MTRPSGLSDALHTARNLTVFVPADLLHGTGRTTVAVGAHQHAESVHLHGENQIWLPIRVRARP
ncbi:hypothetical protein ABZ921_03135 [Streptomyces atriruber]|uniref:Uncharacterized protein n=1 Tax=Streptomyces atriruber TaxID=545121 RepID=A0ABV3BF78_9ACTN